MKTTRYHLIYLACSLLVLLICSSASTASEGRQLWHSRDQFVSLVQQDRRTPEVVLPNDHPVEIPPARLAAMLAAIEFSSSENAKPEQLFLGESLEVLVPQMVQGFQKAAPGEDVAFAIIGLHKTSLGFAKSPKVTTGRAFYKDGRLNIIFGFARKDFNEREDRRLAPLTPGNRVGALDGEWKLHPQPDQHGYSLVRKDWVSFSDAWLIPTATVPVVEKAAAPESVHSAPPLKHPGDERNPAERLSTLNELKEKGLISEDEYRGKRLEILNGL
jgi:hypothetical protein